MGEVVKFPRTMESFMRRLDNECNEAEHEVDKMMDSLSVFQRATVELGRRRAEMKTKRETSDA